MKNVILMLGLLVSMVAFAAELPTKKISLEVKQAGVRDVLEGMLAQSGLKYELEPVVSNNTKVSIEAKEMKWNEVFQLVVDQSKLKYSFDKLGKLHVTKM